MKKSILLELWLAVLTYVVIGAAIFRFLELPKEKEMQAIMKETREKFLRLHPCVSRSSFRVLVQNVVTSVTVGMDPGAYFTNKTRSTWTTEGAIFFAGSLVTTVGYGNVILLSDEGRIFCVFFIVLGIPLYGMLLTSTGEHVGTNLQARISTMENFLTKRQLLGTVMVRFLASIFFIGIGFLFFVALPVVIFITLENWSEVESFFYVIVTLTTVGFGDFVPGTNPVNTFWGYQYLVLLWIVLSLFYFASIITMIGNWIRQEMNNLEELSLSPALKAQLSTVIGRMEDQSLRLSETTDPLGQTPSEEAGESQKEGPMLSDQADQADQASGHQSLGACSLGTSEDDWEEEFTELTTQPLDHRLLTPGSYFPEESREGSSSIDSASSKVAPYNRGSRNSPNLSEYMQPSTGGQTVTDSTGSYNKFQTTNLSANSQRIDYPAHVAYWAEQKHQLPLPLLNLLEEETLEILTKTLQSYRKGIGKDHKLTQQLQMQVEKLSKNLKKRRLPTH